LLALAPGSSESLIAQTVRRIASICDDTRIATGESLLAATRAALPNLPSSAFLGEPMARNTAACIGWGSAVVARQDPEAVVAVLPSDHHIRDEGAYLDTVRVALDSARRGVVTTIGIEPTRPDTGYGYVEAGESVTDRIQRVSRFVEKPDRPTAEQYVASGRYYWNSGMFFFRAADMLAAIREHMPALGVGLDTIEQAARVGPDAEASAVRDVFSGLASVSIDYGVMEKLDRLHVVVGRFGWSDLGSWEASYDLAAKDASSNAVDAGVVLVDATGNLVRDLRGDGVRRVIALVGVHDLCVVEPADAHLNIPRERSQAVRSVVEAHKVRKDTQTL
jgi:mannose-1-phosphate guanylyltransferase